MSSGANVQSIEALKQFRVALCKFVEAARVSLGEAEADLQRHGFWVSEDRHRYWKSEIRTREEKFRQAKLVLLEKKLQKTSSGGRPSCVDEEKAVAVAQRRFEESQLKLANTTRWVRRLEEQVFQYKGLLQSLNHSLDQDFPNGLAWLDRMIDSLEQYVALAPPTELPPAMEELGTASRPVTVPEHSEDEQPHEDEAAAESTGSKPKPSTESNDQEPAS